MAMEQIEGLTALQAYRGTVGFLREYGAPMADSAGISALLEAVAPPTDDSTRVPPASIWRDWVEAFDLAIREPELDRPRGAARREHRITAARSIDDGPEVLLTALQGFDAMIRLLEHLEPSFRAANDILGEIYYSEFSPGGALDTSDPGTWYDWLRHAREAPPTGPS